MPYCHLYVLCQVLYCHYHRHNCFAHAPTPPSHCQPIHPPITDITHSTNVSNHAWTRWNKWWHLFLIPRLPFFVWLSQCFIVPLALMAIWPSGTLVRLLTCLAVSPFTTKMIAPHSHTHAHARAYTHPQPCQCNSWESDRERKSKRETERERTVSWIGTRKYPYFDVGGFSLNVDEGMCTCRL